MEYEYAKSWYRVGGVERTTYKRYTKGGPKLAGHFETGKKLIVGSPRWFTYWWRHKTEPMPIYRSHTNRRVVAVSPAFFRINNHYKTRLEIPTGFRPIEGKDFKAVFEMGDLAIGRNEYKIQPQKIVKDIFFNEGKIFGKGEYIKWKVEMFIEAYNEISPKKFNKTNLPIYPKVSYVISYQDLKDLGRMNKEQLIKWCYEWLDFSDLERDYTEIINIWAFKIYQSESI